MAKRKKNAASFADTTPISATEWKTKGVKPGFGKNDTRMLSGGKAKLYPGTAKGLSITHD